MSTFVQRFAASAGIVAGIVRKELLQVRQDRRMLGISLVAPLLQVLVLGYTATTDIKYSVMVVHDQDRTAESRELIREFTTSGYFRGDASVGLVIPPGFGSDLMAGRSPRVQMVFDGSDANTANVILSYATQIVTAYSAGAARPGPVRLQGMASGMIVPEPRVWFNPDLKSSNYMVPGVVGLVLMIITMTLTSLAVVKEKEIGTLEQLLVSPIRPYELILGKLIPFTLIGFVDVVVVLALARYWFGVPMAGSLPLLFGLSGLFILTTLGLGLFISTISRSQQQAMLIAQFFFFMPFIYLSGFAFPIANMPEPIQYVTYLIPLRYFLEIVRGVFLKGAGIAELWPQALALLALGVAILTLAVARFRQTIE